MNVQLLSREGGSAPGAELRRTCNTKYLHAIQPSDTRFEQRSLQNLEASIDAARGGEGPESKASIVHHGGVTSITIDRFEGRYLLSGGADSSISLWDLETAEFSSTHTTHRPLGSVRKSPSSHSHGITQLSFYPFDSLAFLSSSYDHSVKIWDSDTLKSSASFNLESVIYSHAVSPIASHLLVACATQHPAVRLVDLRSGSSSHALAGHAGPVLTVAWSPKDEHVLASGGTDGAIRFWDVRRSAGFMAAFDKEDSVGVVGYDGGGSGARRRERGTAHVGTVNGIVWTEDGRHMVSTGHDERLRIWNTTTGANTLANFGPVIKNKNFSRLLPCIAPSYLVSSGKDMLFFPCEREILVYEMFEGKLMKRLRTPGVPIGNTSSDTRAGLKHRVVDLAWRSHSVELYSAHGDGSIRAWKPRTSEDAALDEEERQEVEAEEIDRKRKRQVLEDVYHDLAKKRMIF
ncbi:WD40 repeat-like protein [Tothia fuscella]|uniref:WD40 repeat-like protein n=1 Tax=Tothia fuscella TaxID=1048955 RepID=A0A9P4NFF5_9PEZI|nr:WD40 repeat-like protein [Tothia fuscella]